MCQFTDNYSKPIIKNNSHGISLILSNVFTSMVQYINYLYS